jgi:2',3'-cyclic-nucleotide 2'-phosphodiesterase (5'-nucleotidase family)
MKKVWIMGIAAALLWVAAAFMVGCGGRAQARGKLQIMYTGNLRGSVAPCGCHTPKGGLARWAAFMSRHENPDAAWLRLDAGNCVDRDGSGGCSGKCHFMLSSYRDLHYDVQNIGKQEVWMGYPTLKGIMDTLNGAQWISANLVDAASKKPIAKPYVIRDYGKMTVGILGLLSEQDFPKGTSLLDTTRLAVTPYLEAAKRYLPTLFRKTDAVVVMGELSSGAVDTLIREFPDIDLVISTGALRTGETPATIGKTRVLGTGSSGYTGHYATLEFNAGGKSDSLGFYQFQDLLTDVYDEHGEWADRLAAFNASATAAPATKSAAPVQSAAPGGASPKIDMKASSPGSVSTSTRATQG